MTMVQTSVWGRKLLNIRVPSPLAPVFRSGSAPRRHDSTSGHRTDCHEPADSTLVVTRTDTSDRVNPRATREIDVASLPVLVDHLHQAITDRDRPVVIDLGDVTFMGVCGVNALVAAHQSAPTRIRSAPSYRGAPSPRAHRHRPLSLNDPAPRLPTSASGERRTSTLRRSRRDVRRPTRPISRSQAPCRASSKRRSSARGSRAG